MSDFSFSMAMPALPEIFLAFAGMALLVIGVFRGDGGARMLFLSTIATIGVGAVFLLGLDWGHGAAFGGMFILDQFTAFMKLVVLAGLAAALAISIRYAEQERIDRFEYPVLILFAGIGMMIMISANSLLVMYMGLELQSLSLYVLAAIRRGNVKSSEAGIKYFVLGALASGMLLFGCSLVYGYTGSVAFDAIAETLKQGGAAAPGLIFGLVFILAGLAFKVSAVPFHMWTPDVYEGAPTSVTALFAIVPKIAAMALLMRVLFGPFGAMVDDWRQILWFLAAASMITGAFAGIAQHNIKRLMAYSSIGNMGYAMIGIVAGTQEGAGAVIVYLVLYMIMSAGVFGVILSMRRGGIALEEIADLSGLSRTNPLMAYGLLALMFSMSGIPPLAGFFGKILVFNAAVSQGFYTLAILGVLTSVVASYYYLRIIKVMFFDEPADPFEKQTAFSVRAVIFVSVIFVVVFILSPQLLIDTGLSAASSLFAG